MKNSLHCRPVGRIRYLPILSLIALLTAPVASQTCYYPDGSPSIENDIPCVAGAEGACCPSGWECLTNGLCYLSSESYYGRYTCTDKTWKSPGCTGLCTHNNQATGNEAVLNCGGEKWCCDANRPDAGGGTGCCDSGVNGFFQLASAEVGTPTGIGESSVGASSPSTQPSASASSQAPSSATSQSSSQAPPSSTSSQAPPSSTSKVLVIPPSSTSQSSSQSSPDSTSQSSLETFSETAAQTSAAPSATTEIFTTSPSSGSSGLVTVTVTNPASSSQGSGTEAPISASTTSSGTPTPTPNPGRNLAGIIAPAVAVPVVAIILAIIGFFLWRNRRNKKRNSAAMSAPSQYDEDKSAPGTQEPYKYNAVEGEETMGNAGYRGVNPTNTHNTQPHNISPSQAELDGRAISPTHSELAGSTPVDTQFYRPLSYELPGSHQMGGR